MVEQQHSLAYFIEDLWAKGFRLSDEEVQFIYFGKNYAQLPDWVVIFAVRATLQFQRSFDGSFYIGLLDYLHENSPQTRKEAWELLEKRGLKKRSSFRFLKSRT
ncbi:hypothetical protein N781_02545 [Pontibacillus halophilus JSM 076056 = DSM 19796]|uniref:Uncharacterized protein n=1 Tax=Pontibacillus halophilus JSM 076056 = DSM 19796 TaxID=1385510 RepID=A0A0A5GFE3_9BACI|nr:DUF6123 family protein [Pontibacillus halophilus]KGX91936.1 hypothetical protein N781_02545 [Pontibacillus halophilus JSM 076056 = DSM 19796]